MITAFNQNYAINEMFTPLEFLLIVLISTIISILIFEMYTVRSLRRSLGSTASTLEKTKSTLISTQTENELLIQSIQAFKDASEELRKQSLELLIKYKEDLELEEDDVTFLNLDGTKVSLN